MFRLAAFTAPPERRLSSMPVRAALCSSEGSQQLHCGSSRVAVQFRLASGACLKRKLASFAAGVYGTGKDVLFEGFLSRVVFAGRRKVFPPLGCFPEYGISVYMGRLLSRSRQNRFCLIQRLILSRRGRGGRGCARTWQISSGPQNCPEYQS